MHDAMTNKGSRPLLSLLLPTLVVIYTLATTSSCVGDTATIYQTTTKTQTETAPITSTLITTHPITTTQAITQFITATETVTTTVRCNTTIPDDFYIIYETARSFSNESANAFIVLFDTKKQYHRRNICSPWRICFR